jgi:phage portal protein BeeE
MAKKQRGKSSPRLVKPSEQQWKDLSQDTALTREYNELSQALQNAHAVAAQNAARYGGDPAEYMDLSRATGILTRTPQLIPYIDSIAKQGSNVPTGYTGFRSHLQKQNPTGSVHPQTTQSAGLWSGQHNVDGVVNARILRDWADSNEWTRASINVRRQQIGRANISVVPFNELKTYNKKLVKRIQLLLDQPNEYRQNYYDLMSSMIDDVLVLDRGILTKDMTVGREPAHLYNEDGANIKIYADWSGRDNEPRYLYDNPTTNRKVPLRNDEVICMSANPATYRFGLSPVQVLRNTIQADLAATRSAMQMVDMKPPPHLLQLQGATQQQLEGIRARYESDIAGRKEIFWISGQQPVNAVPLVFSARDNQWMEWQIYLARKIAIIFQISPQQLGITFDINKSTASSQQEIFEDTGLIPLLLLVEEYFNTELLADFAPKYPDGRVNFESINLRILFPEITESDRQMHAERAIKIATTGLAGLPSMTLNQVLALFGQEPVQGGNTFYAPTRQGPLPWLSYDGNISEFGPWYATDGSLGGQDAMGGPNSTEEDPGKGSGGSGSYAGPIQTQGDDSPEDKGTAAGANSDRSSGKGDGKGSGGGKKSYERRVGKRWIPNMKG